jgi:hypothetical protein
MALTITAQTNFTRFGTPVRFAAQASIDAGSIGASSQTTLTGTLTGLRTDMFVICMAPASSTNASFNGVALCAASDQLTLGFTNPAGAATPTSGTYTIIGL